MALLFECDRCGKTESVKGRAVTEPNGWLQFNDLHLSTARSEKAVDGGVFCPGCVRDLVKWRQPLPRCAPMDPEQFKRSA